MSGWVATACAECDDQSQHFRSLDDLERHIDPDGCRRIDPLPFSGDPVSSCNRLVGPVGVLFAPLDARMRRFIRSVSISAAATVAVVAFIVVVPRHPCSVPTIFRNEAACERACDREILSDGLAQRPHGRPRGSPVCAQEFHVPSSHCVRRHDL